MSDQTLWMYPAIFYHGKHPLDPHSAAFCQLRMDGFASHAAALTVFRMGAQPSLPTLGEVQTLLRERGCRSVDPAALDPLAE